MSKVLFATVIALAFCASAAGARTQSAVRVGPLADERSEASESAPKTVDKKNAPQPDTAPAATTSDPKRNAPADAAVENKKASPALSSNTTSLPISDIAKPTSTSDVEPKSKNVIGVPTGVPTGIPAVVPASITTPATVNNTGAAKTNAPGNSPTIPAANASTNTAPPVAAAAAAAPPTLPPTAIYRVGSGDVLDIRLLNQPATRESTLYTVMNGGLLEYPLVGDPLKVADLTTDEIAARLAAELKRRAVFDKPQVVVSVREYTSHTVLVSGLVSDPGAKVLRREAVPLYVVIAEAQPRPDAGVANVISRASGQSTAVDLSDSTAMNVLVHPGDIINVATRPREFFYIGGEINMPGQKDFHAGLTLTQAVLASGGVSRVAGKKVRVKVSRQGADGRLIPVEYKLKEIEEGSVPDPRLQPGDRIEVLSK